MGFRLTVQDHAFHALLAASARHGAEAATTLATLVVSPPADRIVLAERLAEIERLADETTHDLVRKVHASFVTPFDHVDIVQLAWELDECTDTLEAAGATITLHRVDKLPPGVSDQLAAVTRMADLTEKAMTRLRRPREIGDYWIEINRLENRADLAHRRLVAEIYSRAGRDVAVALRLKEVVDAIERAANAFEAVADRIEMIVIKGT